MRSSSRLENVELYRQLGKEVIFIKISFNFTNIKQERIFCREKIIDSLVSCGKNRTNIVYDFTGQRAIGKTYTINQISEVFTKLGYEVVVVKKVGNNNTYRSQNVIGPTLDSCRGMHLSSKSIFIADEPFLTEDFLELIEYINRLKIPVIGFVSGVVFL